MHGRDEISIQILVRKSEEKRPLRRLRRRWEDFIRMDHREIGGEAVDWIHLAFGSDQWQGLVNIVLNLP
jgi:hypothetical protein